MATENIQAAPGAARYELTEAAYIDDKLLVAGQQIEYAGMPGYHMVPLNDAAKAMFKKHGKEFVDPILALTAIN
ncbi:hypothetical protein LT85_1027 [Collimonas arenae]|uniref:Uncharacterized protein n=1 Tax=Collimonas arenae TaxID=279058 RepID=A0A0A1F8U1_9BURK|nr:hypothetical protein [Collimonas arenae]AIY40185.1 hypothetical protein LT85_1027 [Collimonas arenae]